MIPFPSPRPHIYPVPCTPSPISSHLTFSFISHPPSSILLSPTLNTTARISNALPCYARKRKNSVHNHPARTPSPSRIIPLWIIWMSCILKRFTDPPPPFFLRGEKGGFEDCKEELRNKRGRPGLEAWGNWGLPGRGKGQDGGLSGRILGGGGEGEERRGNGFLDPGISWLRYVNKIRY